jgi:tyrosyl-DNA phosphodiesterase-1
VINVDDSDDSDDEAFQAQLRLALEASKSEAQTSTKEREISPESDQDTSGPPPTQFLSERAQLEQERLQRQKRLRPDLAQDSGSDFGVDTSGQRAKRPHTPSARTNGPSAGPSTSGVAPTASSDIPDKYNLFWGGELRQTADQHAHPRKDGKATFRLTDVLGKVRYPRCSRRLPLKLAIFPEIRPRFCDNIFLLPRDRLDLPVLRPLCARNISCPTGP